MRTDRRHIAVALTSMLASLLVANIAASPALAVNGDACGVLTQHTMAQAFGLRTTIEHKTVLRGPGNPAGAIQNRCRAFANKGTKPTTPTKRRAALLAGTGAEVKIETWIADSGPSEGVWLANFPRKLEGLKSQARAQFVEGSLHGSAYKPPRFGAEAALGYQGSAGATRMVRAFWWDASTGTLISVNAVDARENPLRASLRKLMAGIVPGVR